MSQEHGPEVVRWYTRARKFPQLIGRTPDGTRLWGGPYTVTQAVAAGLILVVGLNTRGIWARFGLLGNLLTLATVTWAVVWLLGRIPVGSRSPLSVASGLVHAVAAPSTGRLGGRAVRIRRPRPLRHTVVLALTDPTPTPPTNDVDVPVAGGAVEDDPPTPPGGCVGRRWRWRTRQTVWERPVSARRARATAAVAEAGPGPVAAPLRAPLTGVQALLATPVRNSVPSGPEARR